MSIPSAPVGTINTDQVMMVSLAVPKLEESVRVKARLTFTQTLISSISYSKPMPSDLAKDQRELVENEAINVSI